MLRNTLYYGDNLPILRQYIASESVDLVYLDPPFNSNRSYITIADLFNGQEVKMPMTATTFKQAGREQGAGGEEQGSLFS